MANMGYVRFENTLRDLRDCYINMEDDVSEREFSMRKQLIGLCKSIVDGYEYMLEEEYSEVDDDE